MDKTLTHGSLFAGIGGFELAAKEAGIKTLWNCEIETYPRLVLESRFPDVKQYGDIRKLNGAEVEPVDCVTFGSPCQSFSIAGARSGLDGASGLFYEAVRIIKEMRRVSGKPRYAVMENVVGIYSSRSNGRSDFREVLNEICKIKDDAVVIPEPPNGRWLIAGAVVGDGFSLAYRTLCASQFGVAQRRRRMFLVVDLDGGNASEILSEQEGERRDFTPSFGKRQGSAGGFAEGSGSVTLSCEPGALKRMDKRAWSEQSQCLRADMGDNQLCIAAPIDMRNATRVTDGGQGVGVGNIGDAAFTCTAEYTHAVAYANYSNDSRYTECKDGVFPAITKRFGDGGNNCHFVLDERKQAAPITENYVGSLCCSDSKGAAVYFEPKTMKLREGQNGSGGRGPLVQDNISATLSCNNEQTLFQAVCYQETVGALCSSDYKGLRGQDITADKAVVENHYAVRRLTPLECLRLQGFPDFWLDNVHIAEPTEADVDYWRSAWAELGKKKSDNQLRKWLKNPYGDSNAYKAIGNSLAVPCALWVLRGIVDLP
jgi:DNA (cytosine-5)-methyltransferase 1